MVQNITLKFVDGVSIVVPDSLNIITTYVLLEQGDWFEEEIKFVRSVLKPGQQAIDIGANYGMYTLSMARIVGETGRVWAFEPATSTADLLCQSVAANGFAHVVVDRRALSEAAGVARLSLNDHSELNELVRSETSDGPSQSVTLVSLDEAADEHRFGEIAFLKIDAEGEEAAIIRGARRFFGRQSPLVQYEVKAGSNLNFDLVQAFADIGYGSYRLVPGLNALVPFDAEEHPDGALLNLFCCKRDRALQLAAEGQLVLPEEMPAAAAATWADGWDRAPDAAAYRWRNTVAHLPYGQLMSAQWEQTMHRAQCVDIEDALALHAVAHDGHRPMAQRFHALRRSYDMLREVCNEWPEYLRLSSLARVAREFGARMVAVGALKDLLHNILKYKQVNASEPFLATGERFDHLDPKDMIGNWVVASVLEELERSESFSSIYSADPRANRQRLEDLRGLGFATPEMMRRLNLVKQRFFEAQAH